jgi:hypothetical protein
MSWQENLNGDSISWLLEHDEPGVRYLAMLDLLELNQEDGELISAQELAHQNGPISILDSGLKQDLATILNIAAPCGPSLCWPNWGHQQHLINVLDEHVSIYLKMH